MEDRLARVAQITLSRLLRLLIHTHRGEGMSRVIRRPRSLQSTRRPLLARCALVRKYDSCLPRLMLVTILIYRVFANHSSSLTGSRFLAWFQTATLLTVIIDRRPFLPCLDARTALSSPRHGRIFMASFRFNRETFSTRRNPCYVVGF
jgi:hypothetical protein